MEKDPFDMTDRELSQEMREPVTSFRHHNAKAEMERRRSRRMLASAIAAAVSAAASAIAAGIAAYAAYRTFFPG